MYCFYCGGELRVLLVLFLSYLYYYACVAVTAQLATEPDMLTGGITYEHCAMFVSSNNHHKLCIWHDMYSLFTSLLYYHTN